MNDYTNTLPYIPLTQKECNKTFEVRKNDRDFKEGDMLELKEFDPVTMEYTGRNIMRGCGYILKGPGFGLDTETVVISLL